MKITKYDYFKSAFSFIFIYSALWAYALNKDNPQVLFIPLCFEAAVALIFYKKGLPNMKKKKGMDAEVSTKHLVFTIVGGLVFLIILYLTYI